MPAASHVYRKYWGIEIRLLQESNALFIASFPDTFKSAGFKKSNTNKMIDHYLTPHEMRQFHRNLKRDFNHSFKFASFHPWGLVNHFTDAIFFDGV